jgi:hypothetical protein
MFLLNILRLYMTLNIFMSIYIYIIKNINIYVFIEYFKTLYDPNSIVDKNKINYKTSQYWVLY